MVVGVAVALGELAGGRGVDVLDHLHHGGVGVGPGGLDHVDGQVEVAAGDVPGVGLHHVDLDAEQPQLHQDGGSDPHGVLAGVVVADLRAAAQQRVGQPPVRGVPPLHPVQPGLILAVPGRGAAGGDAAVVVAQPFGAQRGPPPRQVGPAPVVAHHESAVTFGVGQRGVGLARVGLPGAPPPPVVLDVGEPGVGAVAQEPGDVGCGATLQPVRRLRRGAARRGGEPVDRFVVGAPRRAGVVDQRQPGHVRRDRVRHPAQALGQRGESVGQDRRVVGVDQGHVLDALPGHEHHERAGREELGMPDPGPGIQGDLPPSGPGVGHHRMLIEPGEQLRDLAPQRVAVHRFVG